MKKIMTLASVAILSLALSACNEETKTEPKEKDKPVATEKSSKTEETTEEKAEETTTESEPIKDREPDGTNEVGDLYVNGYYTNETSDPNDGHIEVDFEGFKINVTPALVDIKLSDAAKASGNYGKNDTLRAIMLVTNAENTNTFDVDYNGGYRVVTDTKEQLDAPIGGLATNPIVTTYSGQVKKKGYELLPLGDQKSSPKSITIDMTAPYKVENGAVDTENGMLGTDQRITFGTYVKK